VLDTGRSGGEPDSNKVTISCPAAIVRAIVEGAGRAADEAAMAGRRMKRERSEYLSSFEGLAPRSSSRSPDLARIGAARRKRPAAPGRPSLSPALCR